MSTVRVYTSAPSCYDYTAWCRTINARFATEKRTGDYIRLVEIEDEYHARHQVERYKSGMYFTIMEYELHSEIKREHSWIHGIVDILIIPDEEENLTAV